MKPTTMQLRPKEWIPFTNFALVDKTPTSLHLQDHLVPFEGAKADPALIWGLYGTLASNQGLFLAQAAAERRGKQVLALQGWYRVDNFDQVRKQIDREIADATGFLHTERLKATFRDEVREVALEAATPAERKKFEDASLGDLLLQCPRLVKALLAEYRKVNLIVHPVRQLWEPEDTRALTVATMRLIKARVMSAQVRYLEEIKVTY